MRRLIMFMFALALLALSGCCNCVERYEPALAQWETNLERLRPTMAKGAKTLPDDLGQTKLDLYDRTVQGIKRVRGAGPEVFSSSPQESTDE